MSYRCKTCGRMVKKGFSYCSGDRCDKLSVGFNFRSKTGTFVGMNNPMFGKEQSEKCKIAVGKINRGRKLTPEQKDKLFEGLKNRVFTDDYRNKLSVSRKRWMETHPEELAQSIQKSGRTRAILKPNKFEQSFFNFLNLYFPDEWNYTGDYSFMISRFNPDFMHKSKKLLIEAYGAMHLKEDLNRRQRRLQLFTDYGYKTLEVWYSELRHPNILVERIKSFYDD